MRRTRAWQRTLLALVEIVTRKPMLTIQDLAARYRVDEHTIIRWHKAGRLPKPIKLPGSRIPLWRPCDVNQFEHDGILRGQLPRSMTKAILNDLPTL